MLERWFDSGVARLHCLNWDADTGRAWAELLGALRAKGKAIPIKDSLIAATALVHGLTVATRNRADFLNAGYASSIRLVAEVSRECRNPRGAPPLAVDAHTPALIPTEALTRR